MAVAVPWLPGMTRMGALCRTLQAPLEQRVEVGAGAVAAAAVVVVVVATPLPWCRGPCLANLRRRGGPCRMTT